MSIPSISSHLKNFEWEDELTLVKLNIKECLSLDLLNFVSIDDFPFYMRWGNAGVTNSYECILFDFFWFSIPYNIKK
jgi:hypothetical protein